MSDDEIVQYSKDQRMPEPGEPVCVICGKYGEYICDENESDVCSIECKQILLAQIQKASTHENTQIQDDSRYINWRQAAYYKFMTWGSYFTNKDIVEIRRGLHITIQGDFYHSLISFDHICLPPTIRSNLTDMGVLTPTPIQMESVPCILSNRDVVLKSNTGSGKTIAYLLPLILLQLDYYEYAHVFTDFVVLILVPSRELAIQIEEVVKSLTKNTVGVRTALLIGGESREQQLYRLRQNVNVLIATPGRLNDLVQSATATDVYSLLKHVRTVVLDEADQLMKSDFQEQVQQLLSYCPLYFQKVIVSATVTANLKAQIDGLLMQPIHVMVDDIEQINSSLSYTLCWCEENQKKKKLTSLLKEGMQKFPLLVVCQTRLEVVEVAKLLDSSFASLPHASMTVETPFQERKDILQKFQEESISLVVATAGIVGRGIELRTTQSIVLWSFPSSISEFIHIAGRIGREGSKGFITGFLNAHNKKVFPGLIKLCKENHIRIPPQVKAVMQEDGLKWMLLLFIEFRNTMPKRANFSKYLVS